MTREEAKRIIEKEELNHYNINGRRPFKPDELVIDQKDGQWRVYATSERASPLEGSYVVFDSENDAWDNFIARARAGKRLEILTNGKYF